MNDRDEAYLAAWQKLRELGYPVQARLLMIDALTKIEWVREASPTLDNYRHHCAMAVINALRHLT